MIFETDNFKLVPIEFHPNVSRSRTGRIINKENAALNYHIPIFGNEIENKDELINENTINSLSW